MANEPRAHAGPNSDGGLVPATAWEEDSAERPLVTIAEGAASLAAYLGANQPLYASFDPSSEKGRLMLHQCLTGEGVPKEALLSQPRLLCDLLCHQVEKKVAEGKVLSLTRICLIWSDDTFTPVTSQGIKAGIQLLVFTNGPPPWRPPIKVRFLAKPKGEGKTLYLLERLDK